MKAINKVLLGLACSGLLFSNSLNVMAATNTAPGQYVVWKDAPISVSLPINQPKEIFFDHMVLAGVPIALKNKLNIANHAGVLTLTALEPFGPTRIEVKDVQSKRIILLTLDASKIGNTIPLTIYEQEPKASAVDGWKNAPNAMQGQMAYITLTRFAEQQLYAPKRLQSNPFGIQLINSFQQGKHSPDMANRLFLDGAIMAMPWASWNSGNHYITAVKLKNNTPLTIDLAKSLTLICGRHEGLWKTVTFFPRWTLHKAGELNDNTMAFLISNEPFEKAMQTCQKA